MGIERKRKIAAWLLLSVFVPMMILGMYHHHADDSHVGETCVECIHHIHHDGHISTSHSCVLCQMLCVPYLAASTVALTVVVFTLLLIRNQSETAIVLRVKNVKSSRAPPFLF